MLGSRAHALRLPVAARHAQGRRSGDQQEAHLSALHGGRAAGADEEAEEAATATLANGCAHPAESALVDGLRLRPAE